VRNFPGSDAEYRFRVEVRTERGDTVIYRQDEGSHLRLIEANWSPDGSQVGLLICNWSRPLMVGYDIRAGRMVPPSAFQGVIEAQLRRKYGRTGNDDVLYWACTRGEFSYPPREDPRVDR